MIVVKVPILVCHPLGDTFFVCLFVCINLILIVYVCLYFW